MKSLKLVAWALVAIAATELPAQAAWNNVFQPTLFGRHNRSSTSGYCCAPVQAPVVVAQASPVFMQPVPATPTCATCNSSPLAAPPPAPAQSQQCTTNYVQRSYYQPVTSYESRSYYEPVTTMQTSFYYEAVTTMQTSFYQDPCTCCVKQACTPVTSYQLRQQNCPVQSWVQRCAQVPVTSYKQMFYLEPQTTCCNTTVGAPIPCQTPGCASPNGCTGPGCAPQQQAPQQQQPPVIEQPRPAPQGPGIGMSYYPNGLTSNTQRPAIAPGVATGSGAWKPSVNLGGITPETTDAIQGQVVKTDRTPKANAQVLFVNAATGSRHTVTANDAGRFNLALASGNYHVFMTTSSGSAAYHSQVAVDRGQNNQVSFINN